MHHPPLTPMEGMRLTNLQLYCTFPRPSTLSFFFLPDLKNLSHLRGVGGGGFKTPLSTSVFNVFEHL